MGKNLKLRAKTGCTAVLIACAATFPLVSNALANPVFESVFDAVWAEINTSYYDAEFGGKDWEAIGEKYRARLSLVDESEAFDALLNEMLRELGDSHFSIASPAYNELLPSSWQGGESGLALSIIGDRAIVARVAGESPAAKAGLKAGFRIISVNGKKVADLRESVIEAGLFENVIPYYWSKSIENRLYGPPEKPIEVVAKSSPLGREKRYSFKLRPYEGLMSATLGNFGPMPMEMETRLLDGGIAYLRFDLWFPGLMEDMRSYIRSLDGDVRGLIIDIRGNPGGIGLMATGLAGMLVDEEFRMGAMRMRRGHLNYNVYPQKGAFLGPVAILIDGNSISTSEIFAAGMQETKRARVFGSTSAGAALPSVFKKLPNRYYLQMAIADYETNGGSRIESVGVVPDEKVALSPAKLRKGEDTVIAVARKWILRQD